MFTCRTGELPGATQVGRDLAENWPLATGVLWHIKKGRVLHEMAAIRMRSGLALRHLAGRSFRAGRLLCGSVELR